MAWWPTRSTALEAAPEIYEFYNLAIGDVEVVSSVHGLAWAICWIKYSAFSLVKTEDPEEDAIKWPWSANPTPGSLRLQQADRRERVIVSDIPGTTRDAVDTYLSMAAANSCS